MKKVPKPKPNLPLREETSVHLHYIVRQLGEQRWMLDRILNKLYRTSAGQATIDDIASQVAENKQKLEGIS